MMVWCCIFLEVDGLIYILLEVLLCFYRFNQKLSQDLQFSVVLSMQFSVVMSMQFSVVMSMQSVIKKSIFRLKYS